jgi:hypothetical protein
MTLLPLKVKRCITLVQGLLSFYYYLHIKIMMRPLKAKKKKKNPLNLHIEIFCISIFWIVKLQNCPCNYKKYTHGFKGIFCFSDVFFLLFLVWPRGCFFFHFKTLNIIKKKLLTRDGPCTLRRCMHDRLITKISGLWRHLKRRVVLCSVCARQKCDWAFVTFFLFSSLFSRF